MVILISGYQCRLVFQNIHPIGDAMIQFLVAAVVIVQAGDDQSVAEQVKKYRARCEAAKVKSLPLRLPPEKDDLGVFVPANEKDARQGRSVDVLEIIDDDDAIVRAWYAPSPPVSGKTATAADPTFVDLWIHGVDTGGWTAGAPVKLAPVFHVAGSQLFDTTCGKRSLPLLKPIDLASFQQGTATAKSPASEPLNVSSGPKVRPVALPDGSLRAYRNLGEQQLGSTTSTDGGKTWSEPRVECKLPLPGLSAGVAMTDRDGEVHIILSHLRGEGAPAVTRFIDLWHIRTSNGRETWSDAQRIWEGYCGAVLDVKQIASGRIIVPFAAWKKPGEDVRPSTGSNYSTCVYSDDGGRSWKLSPSKLTSPCRENYNGNNYGAIEPTIVQLKDGRIWMLMRTQADYLYESFSTDGAEWSEAKPSQFHSSTSPAAADRLPDGRLVLFWNNCEMPEKLGKAGVYGGRDALHGAVSSDEGRTWQGCREVYRDPYRNETPPRRGDRGTAYPTATVAKSGMVALSTGQGNRRTLLMVDPNWLTADSAEDDFSNGIANWHVWKDFGPASGFWRDRTQGPQLVTHPGRADARVLRVCKPDDKEADTASWNFPAAAKGTLVLRLAPQTGSAGTTIALDDRYFNPADDRGERLAMFKVTLAADGSLSSGGKITPGEFAAVRFDWDLPQRRCEVIVNGKPAGSLTLLNPTEHGVSYVRIRSAATDVDPRGCLLESVRFDRR